MVYKTIQTHVKGNILLRLLAFYGWCGRRFLEKPLNPKPSPPPKPVDFFVANFCTQIFTTCLMQLYFLITFWVRLVLYPAILDFKRVMQTANVTLKRTTQLQMAIMRSRLKNERGKIIFPTEIWTRVHWNHNPFFCFMGLGLLCIYVV